MFGRAVVGVILTVAIGCDKQAASAPAGKRTSLAGKPTALFFVFGERSDPRLLPLATLSGGRIAPLSLDAEGWRRFDSLYFSPSAPATVYRNGATLGTGRLRRGMWSAPDPLYQLPGCRSLRPLGAVTLPGGVPDLSALELLATSAPLTLEAARGAITPADLDSARSFAGRAAQRAGLTKSTRDELQLVTQAIHTGASDRPTLVISYMEKGNGGSRLPRHVFAMADNGLEGYSSTFAHSASESAPELRRFIDHLDLTGDGVSEVILEGWPQGGESYLVIMQFVGGRWKEAARGTSSWCADS